ncbi:MAG: ferredoxin [Acidimicrobiales bacterium]
MRLRIDQDRCVGHGRSYALAPEVFGPDERGHGEVLLDPVPPELESDARLGVENCPETAVVLEG